MIYVNLVVYVIIFCLAILCISLVCALLNNEQSIICRALRKLRDNIGAGILKPASTGTRILYGTRYFIRRPFGGCEDIRAGVVR